MMVRVRARRKANQRSPDRITDIVHRGYILNREVRRVWNVWNAKVEAEIATVLREPQSEAAAFIVDGESPRVSVEAVAVDGSAASAGTPLLSSLSTTRH